MALSERSRYTEGAFHWVSTKKRGPEYTVYLNTVTYLTVPYTVHVVREGDTLANLATRYLSDAKRWWILADCNPHAFYPGELEPGMTLRVPR